MTDIVNTYHVGYPDLDGAGVSFLAVLTRDSTGQAAVYSGMVLLPDAGREEHAEQYSVARAAKARLVMARGLKEPYRRAVTFFPALTEREYRA